MKKPLTIAATSDQVAQGLAGTCDCTRDHVEASGKDCKLAEEYTDEFVRAVRTCLSRASFDIPLPPPPLAAPACPAERLVAAAAVSGPALGPRPRASCARDSFAEPPSPDLMSVSRRNAGGMLTWTFPQLSTDRSWPSSHARIERRPRCARLRGLVFVAYSDILVFGPPAIRMQLAAAQQLSELVQRRLVPPPHLGGDGLRAQPEHVRCAPGVVTTHESGEAETTCQSALALAFATRQTAGRGAQPTRSCP